MFSFERVSDSVSIELMVVSHHKLSQDLTVLGAREHLAQTRQEIS